MTLKNYRISNKMSQAEVANRLGVDVTTISKYETGTILPSLHTMMDIRIMTAGAVDMEDFIDGYQRSKTTANPHNPSPHAIPCAGL